MKVHLRDRRTNARVSATIRLMVEADLARWAEWPYATEDQDKAWEWDDILKTSTRRGHRIECYALYAQNRLQGLVSFDLRGHSTSEGHALVVDYVATNPHNRRGAAGLKDVGTALLALAVHRSRELKWEGRLWLESLPGAEGVYQRLGFTKGPGRSREGHATFGLGKEAAARLWQTVQNERILTIP